MNRTSCALPICVELVPRTIHRPLRHSLATLGLSTDRLETGKAKDRFPMDKRLHRAGSTRSRTRHLRSITPVSSSGPRTHSPTGVRDCQHFPSQTLPRKVQIAPHEQTQTLRLDVSKRPWHKLHEEACRLHSQFVRIALSRAKMAWGTQEGWETASRLPGTQRLQIQVTRTSKVSSKSRGYGLQVNSSHTHVDRPCLDLWQTRKR